MPEPNYFKPTMSIHAVLNQG